MLDLPRLPALGWSSFAGPRRSALPSILDRDDIRFTTSGRAAIALALRTLGVGAGDRVLVPTYHCPTMIAPVVAVGAEPVFFPIDASGAPVLDNLSASGAAKVRAMIAAHYFGLPQPMAAVRAFCDERGIALIEDCAHALFGRSDGRPVGSWGDCAIVSLTKFLPVVDGGCLACANGLDGVPALGPLPLLARLRSAANTIEIGARYGRLTGANAPLRWLFSAVAAWRRNGTVQEPELPIEAPVGTSASHPSERWLADFAPGSAATSTASGWSRWIARHAHRERIVANRRRNYVLLVEGISEIPGVRALAPALPPDAAPYVFPLWVDHPERIYHKVRKAGIPVFRWDEVWPSRPDLDDDHGRLWATNVFQLGCHQDLAPADIAAMVAALEALIHERSAPEASTREATARLAQAREATANPPGARAPS